jgi:hypothetical protein
MGVALMIAGVVLAMATINDQLGTLGSQVKKDFLGDGASHGFFMWIAAIVVIGAVLRMLDLPGAGKALIVLIIIAYLLGNANIPSQILSGLQGAGQTPATTPAAGASK